MYVRLYICILWNDGGIKRIRGAWIFEIVLVVIYEFKNIQMPFLQKKNDSEEYFVIS